MYDNDITKLLDIKESGIRITKIQDRQNEKIVTIEKELAFHFCDHCGCRMYSKGITTRHVNHPVIQDGKALVLEIKQRRWQCTNPDCKTIERDEFSFVDRYRRNTNLSDLLIVKAFKNPLFTAHDIAERYHVSDSHVIHTFARYVDMKRRQFTEAICVDEVFLNISHEFKYALVIQDFLSGEPLDLVISRRQVITDPYFLSIPLKERKNVKYIITDMYKSYQTYGEKFFPNAVTVVDAFHVIQAINYEFLKYIRKVIKRIDAKDHEQFELRQQEFHRQLEFKHSSDYFVLKKHYWMLLKNGKDLKYYSQPKYDPYLKRPMNTFDYFEWMYKLEPKLRDIRSLKEEYIAFNEKYAGNPAGAKKALPTIIQRYQASPLEMFHILAQMLQNNFDAIINSFILLEKQNGDIVRLSNGPVEGLNRITKDMKRLGRGYRNFEYMRQRFLYSQRKSATILGVPRKLSETYLIGFSPKQEFDNNEFGYDEDLEDDWSAFDDD